VIVPWAHSSSGIIATFLVFTGIIEFDVICDKRLSKMVLNLEPFVITDHFHVQFSSKPYVITVFTYSSQIVSVGH
jgi:hypothetical protein